METLPTTPTAIEAIGRLYATGLSPQRSIDMLMDVADMPVGEPFIRREIYPHDLIRYDLKVMPSAVARLLTMGLIEQGEGSPRYAQCKSTPRANQVAADYVSRYGGLLEDALQLPREGIDYQAKHLLKITHDMPSSRTSEIAWRVSEAEGISEQRVALYALQSLARFSGLDAAVEVQIANEAVAYGAALAQGGKPTHVRLEHPRYSTQDSDMELTPGAALDLLGAAHRTRIPMRLATSMLYAIHDIPAGEGFTITQLANGTRYKTTEFFRLLRDQGLLTVAGKRGPRQLVHTAAPALKDVVKNYNDLYVDILSSSQHTMPREQVIRCAHAGLLAMYGPPEDGTKQDAITHITQNLEKPRGTQHVMQWGLTGLAYAHGLGAQVDRTIHSLVAKYARAK